MHRPGSALLTLFGIPLISILAPVAAAQAQTGQRISFGVNPTIFQAGQPASAELSISNVSMYPLTLSGGSTFSFFVDGSFGTVSSLTTPIAVNSSSLLAGDFSVSLGPSQGQVNITYNGQTKSFVFGDGLSVKVSLMASAQAGPGKLSLSSQFVSAVNGNLPFTTVSIVDFANSGTSAVAHDQTLIGAGTGAMPLGIAPGGVTAADLAAGSVTTPVLATGAVTAPKISVPLALSGDAFALSIFSVTNSDPVGTAIDALGGSASGMVLSGGTAIHARGGDGTSAGGGAGVSAVGGNGAIGGYGVIAAGGSGAGKGGTGIKAMSGPGPGGLAGDFSGDINIAGTLNATGTKNFRIDHPLDPENKYLVHAAIESSEVLNLYSGNITTDPNGDAIVTLPEWFEAINRDFRYQLTVIGSFAQAIVSERIRNGRFHVRTSSPSVEVSWQVTAVRSDPGMLQNPFRAEDNKSDRERGYYLQPGAYGQPEEKGIEWARDPEQMRRLKQRRPETDPRVKP